MQILRRYVLPTTKIKPGKINDTFNKVSNGRKKVAEQYFEIYMAACNAYV